MLVSTNCLFSFSLRSSWNDDFILNLRNLGIKLGDFDLFNPLVSRLAPCDTAPVEDGEAAHQLCRLGTEPRLRTRPPLRGEVLDQVGAWVLHLPSMAPLWQGETGLPLHVLHGTSTGTDMGGGKESELVTTGLWSEFRLSVTSYGARTVGRAKLRVPVAWGSESRALAGSDGGVGEARVVLCGPQQACTGYCHSFLSCWLPFHGPLALE